MTSKQQYSLRWNFKQETELNSVYRQNNNTQPFNESYVIWLEDKVLNVNNNTKLLLSAISLVELVVKILDKKANRGSDYKKWFGFQNGNGEEVGKDIDRIIVKAKKVLSDC